MNYKHPSQSAGANQHAPKASPAPCDRCDWDNVGIRQFVENIHRRHQQKAPLSNRYRHRFEAKPLSLFIAVLHFPQYNFDNE